jgi:hypothetical protein
MRNDCMEYRCGHIPAMPISHNVNNTSGMVRSMIFRWFALHKVYRSKSQIPLCHDCSYIRHTD